MTDIAVAEILAWLDHAPTRSDVHGELTRGRILTGGMSPP
jgi:hypothetical protein